MFILSMWMFPFQHSILSNSQSSLGEFGDYSTFTLMPQNHLIHFVYLVIFMFSFVMIMQHKSLSINIVTF